MMQSAADIAARKKEAILQAKQMHERAKNKNAPTPIKSLPVIIGPKQQPSDSQKSKESEGKKQASSSPLDGIKSLLKKIGLDFDTAIILVLLYFLIDEQADKTIIFALIYLLL